MNLFKSMAVASALSASAFAVATPAGAVVTTFASYEQIGTQSSLRWARTTTATPAGVAGSGGSLFSIATQSSTVAASNLARFSFAQANLPQNLLATFTLNLTAPNGNPAMATDIDPRPNVTTNFLTQGGLTGSFSFISTTAFTIGGATYLPGTNLLTGQIGQNGSTGTAIIAGLAGSSSGSVTASTEGQDATTVVYTSDVLDFSNTVNRGFSISLDAIVSALNRPNATSALRNFRSSATGTFSSDPAPLVNALVPEPATWGMMLVGFGLVGSAIRVRRRTFVAA